MLQGLARLGLENGFRIGLGSADNLDLPSGIDDSGLAGLPHVGEFTHSLTVVDIAGRLINKRSIVKAWSFFILNASEQVLCGFLFLRLFNLFNSHASLQGSVTGCKVVAQNS